MREFAISIRSVRFAYFRNVLANETHASKRDKRSTSFVRGRNTEIPFPRELERVSLFCVKNPVQADQRNCLTQPADRSINKYRYGGIIVVCVTFGVGVSDVVH